jgi:spermidine/putrescine transport system ATP-binding protein
VSVPGEGPPGDLVKVGVRPEKVTLETNPAPGSDTGWNCVNGTLRVATYTGVSYQYVVDRPDGAEVTVYEQNLGAVPVPDAGTPVRLQWRPEHTFLMSPSDVPIEQEEP